MKYPEQSGNYSPSAQFNYGQNQPQQITKNHNSQNQGSSRRRNNDRFRKDHGNSHQLDRVIKQNDIVIRILKDIRDLLAGAEPEQFRYEPRHKRSGSKPQKSGHKRHDDEKDFNADEQSYDSSYSNDDSQDETQHQQNNSSDSYEQQEFGRSVVQTDSAPHPVDSAEESDPNFR